MKLSIEQFERVSRVLPRQRGNVSVSNEQMVDALLYLAETGCGWGELPAEYGNRHTIYMRAIRWQRKGVLLSLFEALQRENIIVLRLSIRAVSSAPRLKSAGESVLSRSDSPFLWFPHIGPRE
jgi:transposase